MDILVSKLGASQHVSAKIKALIAVNLGEFMNTFSVTEPGTVAELGYKSDTLYETHSCELSQTINLLGDAAHVSEIIATTFATGLHDFTNCPGPCQAVIGQDVILEILTSASAVSSAVSSFTKSMPPDNTDSVVISLAIHGTVPKTCHTLV